MLLLVRAKWSYYTLQMSGFDSHLETRYVSVPVPSCSFTFVGQCEAMIPYIKGRFLCLRMALV